MQTEIEVGRKGFLVAAGVRREAEVSPQLKSAPRPGERIIKIILTICGIISIFTTVGIVFVLGSESLLFFTSGQVDIVEFFTSTTWQPQAGAFGILPLLLSTLITSVIAMLVAGPLGLGGE